MSGRIILSINLIKWFITILILLSTVIYAEGSYKREYALISAAGADLPFSNGKNKTSPIMYLSYWQYYSNSKNSYCEIGARTTTVFAALGTHNEKYNTGIKPIWGHTIYGAYSDYNKGYTDSKNENKGYYMGAELYLRYNWSKIFNTGINYLPVYHYYNSDNNANMANPDAHTEHNACIQLQLKKISEKNSGLIKNGFLATAKYNYSYRSGYSFNDRNMSDGTVPDTSDKPSVYKYYLDLGLYYKFWDDYNIKFETVASLQFNTDRNNAEKIGSLIADHAAIPGYFFCEFYHNKYLIANLKFGIPLGILEARIEPAYYILYMSKDNKVTGVMDYPRKYYQSISIYLSMKIADLIPVFIDYGYGIDAQRRNSPAGTTEKGCHEIRAVMLFAWGHP
ncbi:MAG: hypothetical protein JXN64_05900 [Spirochaetes bacterium]|nr:hypothetical protein [Spirochaetota bacterium]